MEKDDELKIIHESSTREIKKAFDCIIAPEEDLYLFLELSHRGSRVFRQIYMPLYELTDDFPRKSDYFVKCAYFAFWTTFVDKLIDDKDITESQRIMCQYFADCLLEKYLTIHFDIFGNDFSEFIDNYIQFFFYTYHEKNWENPNIYMFNYFSMEKIHHKALLIFTPIHNISKYFIFDRNCSLNLMKNYYSMLLLSDDIADIREDIKNKTLTYPICYYYQIFNELPMLDSRFEKNYSKIAPELISKVNELLFNIVHIEKKISFEPVIIEDTIKRIKRILNL